jgi:hypothetical protein
VFIPNSPMSIQSLYAVVYLYICIYHIMADVGAGSGNVDRG